MAQPPSGGCVLKPLHFEKVFCFSSQPPSGGCVLKLQNTIVFLSLIFQPPSGGCVLKHNHYERTDFDTVPAAFGRLCVETCQLLADCLYSYPAAFGRLCVETAHCKPSSL